MGKGGFFAMRQPKQRSAFADPAAPTAFSLEQTQQLRHKSPMLKRIMTVGGLTLLSRVTGFLRDILLAAILGAGPVADAFFIALRLPNHFRAIFAEGAFNAG